MTLQPSNCNTNPQPSDNIKNETPTIQQENFLRGPEPQAPRPIPNPPLGGSMTLWRRVKARRWRWSSSVGEDDNDDDNNAAGQAGEQGGWWGRLLSACLPRPAIAGLGWTGAFLRPAPHQNGHTKKAKKWHLFQKLSEPLAPKSISRRGTQGTPPLGGGARPDTHPGGTPGGTRLKKKPLVPPNSHQKLSQPHGSYLKKKI